MIRQGATGLGTDWARVFPEDLFEGRGEIAWFDLVCVECFYMIELIVVVLMSK